MNDIVDASTGGPRPSCRISIVCADGQPPSEVEVQLNPAVSLELSRLRADVTSAITRLREFQQAMHDWELACATRAEAGRTSPSPRDDPARAALRAIWDQLATPHPRAADRELHYYCPPEYQPRLETITRIEVRSVRELWLETQGSRFGSQHYRYVLQRHRGEWRIDQRWFYCLTGGRWEPLGL